MAIRLISKEQALAEFERQNREYKLALSSLKTKIEQAKNLPILKSKYVLDQAHKRVERARVAANRAHSLFNLLPMGK